MRNRTTAIVLGISLVTPIHLSLAEPVDKTNTLPNAKPEQCYAKVMVPAKYETKQEKVLESQERTSEFRGPGMRSHQNADDESPQIALHVDKLECFRPAHG